MKLTIFLIPAILILVSLIKRWVFGRKDTISHFRKIENKGLKYAVLTNYGKWASAACFITSYWFIKLGIFWLVVGVILIFGSLVFLLLPTASVKLPNENSPEFEAVIRKRERQSIWGLIILAAWVASWVYA